MPKSPRRRRDPYRSKSKQERVQEHFEGRRIGVGFDVVAEVEIAQAKTQFPYTYMPRLFKTKRLRGTKTKTPKIRVKLQKTRRLPSRPSHRMARKACILTVASILQLAFSKFLAYTAHPTSE